MRVARYPFLPAGAYDRFGPLGPIRATDLNPIGAQIRTRVDRLSERRNSSTSHMKYSTPYIFSCLSQYITQRRRLDHDRNSRGRRPNQGRRLR
ncbi:fumarylacetoacetate hydrolase family protein [Rhizobium sp. CNPSo 3464]|uniref:fumarylacetoacetate hydrolase family protein n=1 Tax=Rhizobium sp. CNPSo 3464 TaxID=3021406 RepID=UPI0033065EB3